MSFEDDLNKAQLSGKRFKVVYNVSEGKQSVEYLSDSENEEKEAKRLKLKEQLPTQTVARIKELAQEKINKRMPEWKQRNLLASALELVIKGDSRSSEENSELTGMVNQWALIKDIRNYSDTLEAQVLVAEDPTTVDIKSGWPK